MNVTLFFNSLCFLSNSVKELVFVEDERVENENHDDGAGPDKGWR